MPAKSCSSFLTSTAPTSRAAITSTASATVAEAATVMIVSACRSCTSASTVCSMIGFSWGQPKSSSMMFSRSTPSESSMSMTALFMTPGPHM